MRESLTQQMILMRMSGRCGLSSSSMYVDTASCLSSMSVASSSVPSAISRIRLWATSRRTRLPPEKCAVQVLLRDEKEGKKKQAMSNKQTRQSNTAHPRQSLFLRKMNRVGLEPTTLDTLDRCERMYSPSSKTAFMV